MTPLRRKHAPHAPRPGRVHWSLIAGLAIMLIVAIAAWWWLGKSDSQAPPRPTAAQGQRPTPPVAATKPAAPPAPTETPPPVDLFAVRNWEPPPPPPPPPAPATPPPPPPKPEPPPLPFKYLGRIIEPDKGEAFLLAQGDRVLAVSVGNVIDGTYKVEKYENGQLYFVYQPMKARQVLAVGTPGNPS